MLWGMAETSKQRETMMVGHKLKHHTAVDISIGKHFTINISRLVLINLIYAIILILHILTFVCVVS